MLVLFLALASVLQIGCSKAMAPSFRAMGVEEIERGEGRSVIEFRVRASNPNDEPIPLRSVTYRVQINGEQVYSGLRSPETTLHKFSHAEFVLPAVVPEGALSGQIDYKLLGTVQYIPPGRLSEVLFDAEIRVPEAPLNITGTINAGG